MLAVLALVFLAIGGLVLSSAEPALRRLGAVSSVVSVAAFAGSVAMVNVLVDTSGKIPFLTTATSTAVYATILWVLHPHGLQQAAAFGASCVGLASIVNYVITDPPGGRSSCRCGRWASPGRQPGGGAALRRGS